MQKSIPKQVTKARAEEIIRETYIDHEDPEITWTPTHWIKRKTGWIPLVVVGSSVSVLWEVILEHGRTYVAHVQKHLQPATEARQAEIARILPLVGGNFPW